MPAFPHRKLGLVRFPDPIGEKNIGGSDPVSRYLSKKSDCHVSVSSGVDIREGKTLRKLRSRSKHRTRKIEGEEAKVKTRGVTLVLFFCQREF